MKKLITTILLLIIWNNLLAQESSNTYSKWYLKPAAGIIIPITNLLDGEITDNLMEYDDNSYYWQIISVNYFLSSKWGIDFTYQGGYSSSISNRIDRFYTELEKKYGNDYFILSNYSSPNFFNIIGGSIHRGYLGLVYRIEKPKYIMLPKLSVGFISFYPSWLEIDLKEKGTNTFYILRYDTNAKENSDSFTIAPSFTFGYRISKRLIANIDMLYYYFKSNLQYREELKNIFTEEISTQTIDYKKNIHAITIGLGLIIELKPVSKKKL